MIGSVLITDDDHEDDDDEFFFDTPPDQCHLCLSPMMFVTNLVAVLDGTELEILKCSQCVALRMITPGSFDTSTLEQLHANDSPVLP